MSEKTNKPLNYSINLGDGEVINIGQEELTKIILEEANEIFNEKCNNLILFNVSVSVSTFRKYNDGMESAGHQSYFVSALTQNDAESLVSDKLNENTITYDGMSEERISIKATPVVTPPMIRLIDSGIINL